jgi:hypothetical protein
MNRTTLLLTLVLGAATAASTASAMQAPAMPKPGPEHERLKADVGTWDAVVEMAEAPNAPMSSSKGLEKSTLLGGMWLITDFETDLGGMPFRGHGITGWDAAKKKYVGSWVDSMAASIGMGESTWDAASKTLSGSFVGADGNGGSMTMKQTVVYSDNDNTRVFTMSAPGPDGKDAVMLRITYKRRP